MALENKYQGKVEFIIANVDDPQGAELAKTFTVSSIPAYFFIDKNKSIQQQIVGETPLAQMEELIAGIVD